MAVTNNPFRYALATNSTASAFVVQNETSVAPSGDGIIDLASPAFGVGTIQQLPAFINLIPFGVDAADLDNRTFSMRVYGFSSVVPTSGLVNTGTLYIPQLIWDMTGTTSLRTFSDHAAHTYFADVVTTLVGPTDSSAWTSRINSGSNLIASAIFHTRGSRYIKIEPIVTLATAATSINCLWRAFDF